MSRKAVRKTKKQPKKVNSIVIMVCKTHKKYKATYPPKTDCLVCWKIYATRMRRIVKTLKIELKELKELVNAKR